MAVMNIRILVTGGTFDKEYDELTGRLFFQDTHVPEMLRRGRCRLDVAVETVMMVDSLDLDDEGRARDRGASAARAPRRAIVDHARHRHDGRDRARARRRRAVRARPSC